MTVIDDMEGLFSHASDVYRAGRVEGRDSFYRIASAALSMISVAHEKAGNVAGFHAAEECCKALLDAKRAADAPKPAV